MTSLTELFPFSVMSNDMLTNTLSSSTLCTHMRNNCKFDASGMLRLALRAFLEGTKTGITNSPAGKELRLDEGQLFMPVKLKMSN